MFIHFYEKHINLGKEEPFGYFWKGLKPLLCMIYIYIIIYILRGSDNVAPENLASQKEDGLPTIIFQGLSETSGVYTCLTLPCK